MSLKVNASKKIFLDIPRGMTAKTQHVALFLCFLYVIHPQDLISVNLFICLSSVSRLRGDNRSLYQDRKNNIVYQEQYKCAVDLLR